MTGFFRDGRYWPLPVPFPDLDAPVEIPDGAPAFGTREEYVDHVRARWVRDYQMQEVHRFLVEWAELPRNCRRPACRRTRRCGDPAVLCYWENWSELRETYIPAFKAALKADRERSIAAGEASEELDAKGIVAEFKANHPSRTRLSGIC